MSKSAVKTAVEEPALSDVEGMRRRSAQGAVSRIRDLLELPNL